MEQYELTVVTTTYNQEKYIEQCIKGIINQKTNFSFQLVISDDNSTDSTREIIKKYQKKYPEKIKPIFRNENLGPMKNFIETLSTVHTKYVALCDGDDYWTDMEKLQKQYNFLEANSDYSICFHKTFIFFEDKSQENVYHPLNIKTDLELDDLIKENFIPANTVMYRWRFHNENNLKAVFPSNIVPGDYYIHFLHAQNGKIHFIDECMSSYRRQASGMWYLSTQPDKQDEFYLYYGEPYLKFFNEVEKLLGRKDIFKLQKDWIIVCSAKAYLHKKKWKNLWVLYENEIRRNPGLEVEISSSFSKKNKFLYYLLVKPSKLIAIFFKKIKSYIKK